jgi:hypothetical protein
MTFGKRPVMTNSMEAIRDGVKQETADELVGIDCHHLLATTRAIILSSECDAIAIHADEPGVGDGNAMGVAAEIGQHLSRSGKWRLDVDNPVDAARCFDGAIECGRISHTGNIAEELKLAQVLGLL